jgi:glycosyltransferase involved in cell wall biosynthesis
MKRVLHVMANLERSGMEMMLISSAEQWRHFGYSCDVLATAREIGPIADEMRDVGYGVFHIPFRSDTRYLPSRMLIPDFFKLCKTGRYDIVHIHTEAATPIFAILAKLAGVKDVVLSVHNTFRFDGVLRLRKRLERALIRALGCRYGMVSDAVIECEQERFGNPGVRLWNWLDTEHFRAPNLMERQAARRRLGCNDNQFVLVSVANCNTAKNHTALLKALPRIKQVASPLYFHVGREHSEKPERALAKQLGIEDEVRFMESQPDPRMFFWAADAFIMPSLYEGLGNSALEAIASGCPAVLTDVSGLKEIAAETKWATTVDPNEESIAKGLCRVAEIPFDIRMCRALEDSTRIRKRFSTHQGMLAMIENLYAAPLLEAIPAIYASEKKYL